MVMATMVLQYKTEINQRPVVNTIDSRGLPPLMYKREWVVYVIVVETLLSSYHLKDIQNRYSRQQQEEIFNHFANIYHVSTENH